MTTNHQQGIELVHQIPDLKADFGVKKEELIKIASALQQDRTFDQEIQLLEEYGGDQFILQGLNTDLHKGILGTELDLAQRNAHFGNNLKPPIKTKSFFALMCNALEDLILRILLVAACVDIILSESTCEPEERKLAWIDGFAIFVAVVVCSTVAAGNDYSKEKQFQKLNSVAESRKEVRLIRNGHTLTTHQSKVLTGDLIIIENGMPVPADCYLIEGTDVETDESAMTGETDPVKKAILSECIKKRDQIIAEGGKHTANPHDVPSPILMSGTKILEGTGKMIVLVVGDDSCIGKISKILSSNDAQATPLQEKLEAIASDIGKFGLWSAIIIVLILIIRFLIELGVSGWHWESDKLTEILGFFIIGITVIVVAIPEGLPLSVTISLAYSVKKMLVDNNLVRKLQACETMGGADIICSDKTGTLTQNNMSLTRLWNERELTLETYQKTSIERYVPLDLQSYFIYNIAVNSEAELANPDADLKESGSKTEIAFLKFLNLCDIDYKKVRESVKIVAKYQFSSKRKRMSVILDEDQNNVTQRRLYIKGASEMVLSSCVNFHTFSGQVVPINSDYRQQMEKAIENMASQALRTICMAYKDLNGNEDIQSHDENSVRYIEKEGLTLIGIFGIKDILREEVPGAVALCQKAGITVKMVTGDMKITARAIAKECGIIKAGDEESLVLEGAEFMQKIGGVVCKKCNVAQCDCPINQDKLDEMQKQGKKNLTVREDVIANKEEFGKIYKKLNVLARSRPEDKYAMVVGLKQFGHVVAVTGDGTNDAPALKKADVGFSMGIAGTDVAREASSIVLQDDNFNSIVAAVMWGRNIYDSIKKFLQFQLTVNVVAVFLTIIGSAAIKQEILTPIQMLWVNLIMDSFASLALATEAPTKELLLRQPHRRDDYIISKKMFKNIIVQSIFQLGILVMLIFTAEKFIPEYSDDVDKEIESNFIKQSTLPNITKQYIIQRGCYRIKYSDATGCNATDIGKKGSLIRSGRKKAYSDGSYLFKQWYNTSGGLSSQKGLDYEFVMKENNWVGFSRHFTVIFNTFVHLQIFNFINARVIDDKLNIFKGIFKNWLFGAIVVGIFCAQILITTFGSYAFQLYKFPGLHVKQYLICVGFGATTLISGLLIKLIPEQKLPAFGKKQIQLRANSGLKRNTSKRQSVSIGLVGDRQEGSHRVVQAAHYQHQQ